MSVPVVVDMNLSVEWAPFLGQAGWPAVHWSDVGDPRAEDATIMAWALARGHVDFTHDLDFGTALALTHAGGPSVIQVRGQRVLPEHMGPVVLAALTRYEAELSAGALVVVDPTKSRCGCCLCNAGPGRISSTAPTPAGRRRCGGRGTWRGPGGG